MEADDVDELTEDPMPIVIEQSGALAEATAVATDAAMEFMAAPISAAWVPARPRLSPGFAVRRATFDDIERGRGVDGDVIGGRFFLLEDHEGVSAAIHVESVESVLAATHVTHGPEVIAAVETIAWVEDELGERQAELSFFTAPSVFVEAVRVDDEKAWFILVDPEAQKFNGFRPITHDAFAELLVARARSRLEARSE